MRCTQAGCKGQGGKRKGKSLIGVSLPLAPGGPGSPMPGSPGSPLAPGKPGKPGCPD